MAYPARQILEEREMPSLNVSSADSRSPVKKEVKKTFQLPNSICSPKGITYSIGKQLGKGGFATCYTLTDVATGKEYAGKVVLKSSLVNKKGTAKKLKSEILIHQSLTHKFVVPFVESFETSDAVYMILGLCHNNTLMEMLRTRKTLSEPEVQYLGLQLLEGLRYLHDDCDVLHRDLKLGNLMLSKDMELRIGDFGLAAKLESSHDRRKTVCGTPNYIAPEVLDGDKTDGHSFEVDIWGFGVVLYTLLVGRPPFETNDVKSTYKRIKEGRVDFPESPKVSQTFEHLIRGILQIRPDLRFTLAEIRNHEFFRSPFPPECLPVSALKTRPKFTSSDLVARFENLHCSTQVTGGSYPSLQTPPNMQHYSKPPLSNSAKKPPVIVAREECCYRDLHNYLESSIEPSKKMFEALGKTSEPARRIKSKHTSIPSSFNYVVAFYEEKDYGLGVLLANGVVAIRFNDLTQICWPLNAEYFVYLDRTSEVSYPVKTTFQPSEKQMQKKVVLLDRYKGHLLSTFPGIEHVPAPRLQFLTGPLRCSEIDYLSRFQKSSCGVLFKLGGGNIQFKFSDKSDIVFQPFVRNFLYINKHNREPEITTMEEVVNGKVAEIYSRVHYLKNVLVTVIPSTKGSENKKE